MKYKEKKYFTLGLHDTFYPFIEVSEPVIYSALGAVYSRLYNNNNNKQKTAVLGTSHIIQKVLQCEA
jgi:hypothetical protein